MIHELKTRQEYFEDILKGQKTFEIRKDDRPFAVGDFLALNELDGTGAYTGRCCVVRIAYIMREKEFVKDGFAVMGVNPCAIETIENEIIRIGGKFAPPAYERKNK